MRLKIEKDRFLDEKGRSVLLRGVNLGGGAKIPFTPNGATHIKTDFKDHREVSFVGRPFPLKKAEEHYKRLKHWGFNCLRFLVTWEAIEHENPGKYDQEYLEYIEEVLKIAEEFKFYFFIDPHQDVWSRMSGGDGAPGWTFEKVGLDFTKFDESEAAIVMQYRYDPNDPSAFLPMVWPNNHIRIANRTMWSLFFGGNDFAPSCKIDGMNAQDYLQKHYFESIKQVALRVKDNDYLIGFETLNETSEGFIETKLIDKNDPLSVVIGLDLSPADALFSGSGFPRKVAFKQYERTDVVESEKIVINPNKISSWLEGYECIWKKEGVWGLDESGTPKILKDNYFLERHGKKVDFCRDYLSPFIIKYSEIMRSVVPEAIIFFEAPVTNLLLGNTFLLNLPENIKPIVHAGHWYDTPTLFVRSALIKRTLDYDTGKVVVGKENVQKIFNKQIAKVKNVSEKVLGGIPTLIGEFGLPYDLDNKVGARRFKKNPENAWKKHVAALDMYYNALDANLLSSTHWNYTPENTNEWGDLWNLEDLSIFSRDQQLDPTDINSGGRGIKGFCRPYFVYCAGKPLKMEFDINESIFIFRFDASPSINAPTVIYVPKIQYPKGFVIESLNSEIEILEDEQLVLVKTKESDLQVIKIIPKI